MIRTALETRDVRALVPRDLAVGTDWSTQIRKQVEAADFVIGVVGKTSSPQVFFELGHASAAGRRILLISPPTAPTIDIALRHVLNLRTSADNAVAIGFALDQLLAAPGHTTQKQTKAAKLSAGLGSRTDAILAAIDRSLAARDWKAFEQTVADVLRDAGADIVSSSAKPDSGGDLAVWSDALEPFVGNPLIVELKARLGGRTDARRVVGQVNRYVMASGASWALLLYGEGPSADDPLWHERAAFVLAIPVRDFVESLRTRGYAEVVRDLRNRRVHGASR